MKVTWQDGYKFEIESRGHKILTDQPKPVGDDAAMMPVEFLSASLASCIGVYVVDYLLRNDLPAEGLEINIESQGARNPNRIGAFQVQVDLPTTLSDRQRISLERLAKACTVHHTLEHPPTIDIALNEAQ